MSRSPSNFSKWLADESSSRLPRSRDGLTSVECHGINDSTSGLQAPYSFSGSHESWRPGRKSFCLLCPDVEPPLGFKDTQYEVQSPTTGMSGLVKKAMKMSIGAYRGHTTKA
jgi:hypothetical protein